MMKLALSENRITKWRDLYHELTPREYAELEAYYSIEPWGDSRDDLRMALMTAIFVASVTGHEIDVEKLAGYINGDEEQVASPDQVAAMMRSRMSSRSSE